MFGFLRRTLNRFRKPARKLQTVLCFHMNQYFDPYVEVVADVSYRPLLKSLLEHPEIKVSLNVTPTLQIALAWLAPDVLEMVSELGKRGQAELLSTTFSQSIIKIQPSSAMIDISLAGELTGRLPGFKANTFWNPERVVWPGLFDILMEAGISRISIEAEILEKAGLREGFRPLIVSRNERSVVALVDDEKWRCAFNNSLSSRRAVKNFVLDLKGVALDGMAGDVFLYAEDAEAIGLWAYESSGLQSAKKNVDNFKFMLDVLSDCSFLEFVTFSEAAVPEDARRVSPTVIPDETAGWIRRSFQDERMKFREPAYSDWNDFLTRSEEIKMFSRKFSILREKLENLDYRRWTLPGRREVKINQTRAASLAATVLFARQYEFGCPGLMGENYRLYDTAGKGFASLSLAHLAKTRGSGAHFMDIDEDKKEELVLTGEHIAVAFRENGPLLSLFEYETGAEYTGAFIAHSSLIGEKISEPVSRRLWPWLDGIPLPDTVREGSPVLRRYALAELAGFSSNEKVAIIFSMERSSVVRSGLCFVAETGPVRLKREVDISGRTLTLRYRFTGSEACRFYFEINTCFLPDYLECFCKGKKGVTVSEFSEHSGSSGIRITSTDGRSSISISTVNKKPDRITVPALVEGAGADMLFILDLEEACESVVVVRIEVSDGRVRRNED